MVGFKIIPISIRMFIDKVTYELLTIAKIDKNQQKI